MNKVKSFIRKYFSSFAYFYRYLRTKVFIAFFLSVFVSLLDGMGLTMFVPLLQVIGGDEGMVDSQEMGKLAYLIDGFQNSGIPLTIVSVLLLMILFFSLKGVAIYFTEMYRIYLQESFIRKIRLSLLSNLNQLSFKSFVTSDAGRIQNTMTGEVDRVSRSFRYYFQTFQEAVMVLVYLGFAFAVDPKFAFLVMIGGLLTNFLYKSLYKHTKGASRKLTTHTSKFQGQIIQHVGNFKYLNATGTINKFGDKLEKTVYEIEKSRRKIGSLASLAIAAREPMLVAVIALVILLQVKLFGGAIAGILVSLLFFFRALHALTNMQNKWNSFLEYSGSLENMQDFEKELKSNRIKDGKQSIDTFEEKISLQNVDFYYGKTQILKDISLDIVKNESIAFVGESGSGKTTLINMISGLFPEDRGSVYVDNVLLRNVKKETYQQRIGYVSQDPVVFNDTIYNNITLWAEKSPENIKRFEQSIQQASLSDLLKDLPAAAETYLGNNGINLSGGQKQRVSIARELFKDIDILILDEATSALDSETEKAIQESIDALKGNYTILMIAHRLSTIQNADRIVFMDKGSIIDIGSFEDLANRQERFKKMVELQEL